MLELLAAFSIEQIIIYALMLGLAIKGGVDFTFWAKEKYQQKFDKDHAQLTKQEMLEEHYKKCSEQHQESVEKYNNLEKKIDNLTDTFNTKLDKMEDQLVLLSSSSKNDIKAWIVETHHKCIKEGFIDDFTKDIVEKRFEDYTKLGGNSYVKNLVEEMRTLPLK